MKSKKFEARVVIVCILITAITIGLGIIFNENEGSKIELKENEYKVEE